MVSPYTDPREYWRRTAKAIGLQEFGTEADANMFLAQMSVESGDFNLDVIYGKRRGGHGETGVAQYMPDIVTARGINPANPEEMLKDAARYMKEKRDYFGDWESALVNYNSGYNAPSLKQQYGESWKEHIPKSTRDIYLPAILNRAKQLGPIPGQPLPYQLTEEERQLGIAPGPPPPSPFFPDYTRTRNQEITDYLKAKIVYQGTPKAETAMEQNYHQEWLRLMSTPFRVPIEFGISIGERLGLLKKRQQENTDLRAQTRQVATQEDIAFTEMTRRQYRAELVDALPALVMTGRVKDDQDVRNLLQSKVSSGFLTEPDIAWATQLYQNLSYLKRPSAPGSAKPTFQELYAAVERPARPTPIGVHQLTDEALLQSLYQLYIPGRPYGLTWEQQAELYGEAGLELGGTEVERLTTELGPKVDDFITQWETSDEMVKAYKTGVREFEIPKLSFIQWMKLWLNQPMLAASEALEPYNKYVVRPLAAMLSVEAGRIAPFLGEPTLERRYKEISKDATSPGDRWMAYEKAYQNWDEAPWAYKLLLECLVDPLNWGTMGLAVLAKSSKVAKLPVLGKFIGESFKSWMSVADLPYTIGKKLEKVIPYTTHSKALLNVRGLTEDWLVAAGSRYSRFVEGGFTAEQLADTLTFSVKSYLDDPLRLADTAAGRLGARMSALKFIEEDEIARMARYLGLAADYEPSQNTILTVNKIFENINPALAMREAKSLLGKNEAAGLLLASFPEVPASTENFQKALQIVSNKLLSTLEIVPRITATTDPMQMIRRGQNFIYNLFTANVSSKVAVTRANQKMLGSILDKMDFIGKTIWRNNLERRITVPLANQYLLFPTYGPWNLGETAMRSALDGVIPTVGTKNVQRIQRLGRDLTNVSYDLRVAKPLLETSALTSAQEVMVSGRVEETGRILLLTKPSMTVRRFVSWVTGKRLSIGSASDYNKNWGAWSTEMRAHFESQKYLTHLAEDAPAEVSSMMGSLPEVSNLRWQSLTKKDVDGMAQYIAEESLRGPEAVEGVKDIVRNLTNQKAMTEVADILGKDTIVQQPIKDAIFQQARRGTLWDNIDDVVNRAGVDQDIMNMQQLEYMRIKYDDMAKGIAELDITTEDELINLMSQMNETVEAPERLVSISRQSLEDRAMDIIDEGARRKLHHENWAIIERFVGDSNVAVSDILTKLQNSARTLKPAQLDNILSLTDKYRFKMEAWSTARTRESALFNERLATKVHLNPIENAAWWDETNALRRRIWDEAKRTVELVDNDIEELSNLISNVRIPPIKQFGVAGKLTTEDIAYIFSTTGDDVANKLYRIETQSMLGRDTFTSWVRRRASAVGKPANKTANDLGFTTEAVGEAYDNLVRSMSLDPRMVNVLTPQREALKGIKQSLWGIRNGMGVDDADIQQWMRVIDETSANLKKLPQFIEDTSKETWRLTREEAMGKARSDSIKAFTQYGPDNMVNAVMHGINPFWTYEIQRWPWLWRTFVRYPGIFTGGARYVEYSDRGYIHIPGTNLEINPFRGSVFMGMFTGLYMRDYPEYEDYFPGAANFIDRLQRMGFYPNVFVGGALALLGSTGRPDWSRLFPQWVRTPLETIAYMFPESVPAKLILEQILPDRFRKYLALLQLGKMGIEGSKIYGKVWAGDKLEKDEQQLWDRAQSQAAIYSAMFEQFSIFRFNPEERIAAYKQYGKLIEEMTGIPVEVQERTNRLATVTGKRFIDLVPLDPLQTDQINELESMKLWMGVTTPLLPPGMQNQQIKIQQFWDEYETMQDKALTGFYDRDGKLIQSGQNQLDDMLKKWRKGETGGISPNQWVSMRGELQGYLRAQFDALKNSEKFKEVPVTIDERVKYMQEQKGIQPTFHPAKELLWLYYELQPELRLDEDTGMMEYDYDTYFAMVDWMIDAVPEGYKDRFIQMLQRTWSPLVKLRWQTSRDFTRPYRTTRIIELSQYTPEEQVLIKRFSSASPLERDTIRAETTDDGRKLLAKYGSDLSTARKNLRLMFPELNAWLSFWSPTTTLLTPESATIYETIMDENLGPGKKL